MLVPLKAFSAAKARLAAALDPPRRAALARALAARVLAAAAPLPVAVACDDGEVAHWARRHGAVVVSVSEPGLDRAVTTGVAWLERVGATEIVVAHGDLPAVRSLAPLTGFPGITLVPDRRGDGTNVIVVPAGIQFPFAYGRGSFARHLDAARRLGGPWRVVTSPELSWDVDEPPDLPEHWPDPTGSEGDPPPKAWDEPAVGPAELAPVIAHHRSRAGPRCTSWSTAPSTPPAPGQQ